MGMGSVVVRPMLDDGGRKDAWHTPDRVVGSGKPNRPQAWVRPAGRESSDADIE